MTKYLLNCNIIVHNYMYIIQLLCLNNYRDMACNMASDIP